MLRVFIILLTIFTSVNCYSQKNYIPKQAYNYRDIIYEETLEYYRESPHYNYIPSLIEHESCISLTHSKCWNPSSRLKTSREEGAGLGQLTRAFNPDGSIRFDSLSNLKRNYPKQLSELSWGNIYVRADLQIRAIELMVNETYKSLYNIDNVEARLHMTDSAYNGGLRDLQRSRRECGLARNCNPGIWFDNVERYCVKSKKSLYGNRSACDINIHHVKDVFKSKLPKYQKDYINLEYLKSKNATGVNP